MWILLLLAVNVSDPTDIPGRATIQFRSQQECEQARATVTSWLKFESFKVTTQCQKKS